MIEIDLGRAMIDFEYYCQALLWIKSKTKGICPFIHNDTQRILNYGKPPGHENDRRFAHVILHQGWLAYEKAARPIRQFILKARQQGLSTLAAARLFNKAHFGEGVNCLIVAHDDDATKNIFEMIRYFYQMLVSDFKPASRISNANELLFQEPRGANGLNSWIRAQTAGWKDIGRSKMTHHLLASEIAFWRDHEGTTDGLFETVPYAPDTSIILETTADFIGSWAHNLWERSKKGDSSFDPVFLPWYLCSDYSIPVPDDWLMIDEERDIAEEFGLSKSQMAWRRYKIGAFEDRHPGRGLRYFQKEYPATEIECFQAAGQGAFPEDAIEWLYRHTVKRPTKYAEIKNDKVVPQKLDGRLKIWETPKSNVRYAIGVDVAGGVGGDYSAICVIAYPGYRQVAEWADKHTDPKQLAKVIAPIARWYNEAVVAVEVSGGLGLLTNSILWEIYPNLYRWEYFDKQRRTETEKFGWDTSYKTKELLVEHANGLLIERPPGAVVRSIDLLGEMKSLVGVASGDTNTVYPTRGLDLLMAWLIALMCMWRKIARFDFEARAAKAIPQLEPAFFDAKMARGVGLREDWEYDWMSI